MFATGVLAHTTWASFYHSLTLENPIIPLSQLREDRLHKLYEAAQMTARESDTKRLVFERLVCTKDDGLANARLTTIGEQNIIGCKTIDGTVYELNSKIGTYGPMFDKIENSHLSWSLKNLEFLKEVSTSEKAEKYVHQHISEIIQ